MNVNLHSLATTLGVIAIVSAERPDWLGTIERQQSAPTNKMRLIKWLATVLNVHSQFVHDRSFFRTSVVCTGGGGGVAKTPRCQYQGFRGACW